MSEDFNLNSIQHTENIEEVTEINSQSVQPKKYFIDMSSLMNSTVTDSTANMTTFPLNINPGTTSKDLEQTNLTPLLNLIEKQQTQEIPELTLLNEQINKMTNVLVDIKNQLSQISDIKDQITQLKEHQILIEKTLLSELKKLKKKKK